VIPVEEALNRILSAISVQPAEQVSLRNALGRVLAADVTSRRTQPPSAMSAMDGYAVRAADVAAVPAMLRVVADVPAGASHDTPLKAGEAARIFTGAPLPPGTDAIVIQEDTDRDGDTVTVKETARKGAFVRAAGLDFTEGETLLKAGKVLNARDIGLAAAMNRPWLMVRRRPRIAILATGDEVVMPGDEIGPNQIVSSNSLALAAAVDVLGGEPVLLGIATDDAESLRTLAAGARGADMLVTTGGASVGEHDLVQSVLGEHGLEVDFWKIAMRPGKPLIFGSMDDTLMLGLPGNPVSTLVCATLFLAPAIRAMLGQKAGLEEQEFTAICGADLKQNDRRQDYLRASLVPGPDGTLTATPFDKQDSSMLRLLQQADCLVIRAPHAEPLAKGDPVRCLRIPGSALSL